jgi:hypothetical protein
VLICAFQNVIAQILELNPEYKPEDFEPAELKHRRASLALARLRPRNKDGIVCNVVGGCLANWFDVLSLVQTAQPNIQFNVPGGPGYCINVVRWNSAGFFLCNDVSINYLDH